MAESNARSLTGGPINGFPHASVGRPVPKKNVLYLKLDYTITSGGLKFFLNADSGDYNISSTDIGSFAQARALGQPLPPKTHALDGVTYPLPGDGTIPTGTQLGLDVKNRCAGYILYELCPKGNWEFCRDTDALTTSDDPANGDYVDLHQVDDNGVSYQFNSPGKAVDPPEQGPTRCRVAYISCKCPSTNGDPDAAGKGKPDSFNLYIRLTQTDGSALNLIIDPDVQNTGTPPRGTGTGGGSS
ncbi:MAG TPA: hypothetical protein VG387_12420 [Rhizomicrobium sp.]|jgi:hypothetical protein|nr:hypothetical protein [Rhizomicrobium sp.]